MDMVSSRKFTANERRKKTTGGRNALWKLLRPQDTVRMRLLQIAGNRVAPRSRFLTIAQRMTMV
jgi:hypothetical protein